jgi:MerR family transcriptional regulator/heat shock protein HspR
VSQVQQAMTLIGDGLTLSGVRRVLDLQQQVRDLEAELAEERRRRA